MAISYIYNGEPMTGTVNDDFFIAYKSSTGTDNNTVNGNGGDDLVVGDSSDTWIPAASYSNGSIATAFNLETLTSTWTTAENEMFGDWTIPHSTVMCDATIGQSEFFRVAIGAGQQITIDLDFASNTAIGNTRDLVVELQDYLGNIVASADDSLVTDGGRGSFSTIPGGVSSSDPYLTFTVATGGIYYINVRPFGGGPGSTFADNTTFVMNVSVGGHAVNATNPVQGADTINGGDGDDALFGQGGGDVINGDGGDDFIDSGSGGDIVHGGEGDDTIYGGDGTEENIHGDNGNDRLISGGEGHYYGDAGDDIIYAGLTAGINEILDGGADIDTIDTTTWNGTYVVNLVTGVTNFGESFINFENVVTGNGADTITGTDAANVISTQAGIDIVNAGAGDDVVAGGADGDTLDGGADSDILDYRASSGAVTIDLITNSASGGHAAGDVISNFEGVWGSVLGDTLTADAGDNELRGFAGNDVLSGGIGNDILDGGTSDDTMTGGAGNDTYIVDSVGDTVVELAGQGKDTVESAVNFSLAGRFIENLTLTGSAAITATGNALDNTLVGNAGANVLNGGKGADEMRGGEGDDTYIVDNAGDKAFEVTGQGDDTVKSSVTFSLAGQHIENLTLTGAGAIDATGNGLANTLIGNAKANVLDGGAAGDEMRGGKGDDRYIVDNAKDQVFEANHQGIDTVESSVNFSLAGQSIENLTLTGAATRGTGNGAANVITGSDNADTLLGGGGSDTLRGSGGGDTLSGQKGVDTLTGGAGADQFRFAAGDTGATAKSADVITDFNHAQHDRINLAAIDAIAGTAANEAFDFIGAARFSGNAGELRYTSSHGDTLVTADTDGDKTADFVIKLTGSVALVAADFVLGGGSAFAADADAAPAHPWLAREAIGGHSPTGAGLVADHLVMLV